uniref:Uncharacterized protein n=1 Tax=Panagrolaimus sp. PS1159 TaxID=55785 RepID=A0AC35G5I3_9BILA
MQKSSSKTMDNDIKELEKKFDKLEPKEMPKSANLINSAKQHLSRGSGSAVNKYKSQSKSNSPTPQEKKLDSPITGSNSFVRSIIAAAAAPIAYDNASFQEVMNQANKDGGDEKKLDSPITGSNSFVRSIIAAAAAPIAYDNANFQEVMNQANKDGGDEKKQGNTTAPNPKSLKEKSASSTALRVGPFAAIRENEMKRKKKASLDLNPTEED